MGKYKIGKRGGIATARLYNIWLHLRGEQGKSLIREVV